MQRDIAEVEQRMLNILKRNSRATITEISKSLGISRVTAKKVLNSLVQNGRIRKFTILLDEEEKELAMVQVDQIENIPASLILERFHLIDNSYIIVLYYEDLLKLQDVAIKRIEVARERTAFEGISRLSNIHCDYCGNMIR